MSQQGGTRPPPGFARTEEACTPKAEVTPALTLGRTPKAPFQTGLRPWAQVRWGVEGRG